MGVLIGVDCLFVVLCEKGCIGGVVMGLVVVIVMDCDCMVDYQVMVIELCNVGICVEVYFGNLKNFGNQLKYVDKWNFLIVVIEGGDEKVNGVIQIKDLILGVKIVESVMFEEWKECLSQFEVLCGGLVVKVCEIFVV